jgi:hypothetical protein
MSIIRFKKVKDKTIPVQALKVPGSWSSEISRQSAHEGGKVSPTRPGNIPGTQFCQRLSRPQGHSATWRIISMKNSDDTNEPVTFRIVAQCLNYQRHRVPPIMRLRIYNSHDLWTETETSSPHTAFLFLFKTQKKPKRSCVIGYTRKAVLFGTAAVAATSLGARWRI